MMMVLLVNLLLAALVLMVAALFFFFLGLAWRVWRSALPLRRGEAVVAAEREKRLERSAVGTVKA